MSSQEECRANQQVLPGSEEDRQMIAGSGRRLLPLYDSSNRHGSSLRMFTALCLSSTEWRSSRCALRWKVSVTKSNRLLFQLVPSMRRNKGIASGWYPTARAAKRGARNPITAQRKLVQDGRSVHHRLEDLLCVLEQKTGVPNPQFVEWLMGYPQMWTEMQHSATRSFRRLRRR